jgi:putative phage-type endonuclease
MEQRSPEWFTARQGRITASRFADVLTRGRSKDEEFGKTALSYAYEIVAEAITGEHKNITAPALEWGISYEHDAKTEYEMQTFNKVQETGYVEFDNMIGGSPDGLVDLDGIIEIKCPFSPVNHLLNYINHKAPEEYVPQIQGYLMITGRKWCDFISYDVRFNDKKIVIVRVDRDDEYIAMLNERLMKFKQIVLNILNKVK